MLSAPILTGRSNAADSSRSASGRKSAVVSQAANPATATSGSTTRITTATTIHFRILARPPALHQRSEGGVLPAAGPLTNPPCGDGLQPQALDLFEARIQQAQA